MLHFRKDRLQLYLNVFLQKCADRPGLAKNVRVYKKKKELKKN